MFTVLFEKNWSKLTVQQLVYTAYNHDCYENSVEPHRKKVMINERTQVKIRIHIMAPSRKTTMNKD